MLNLLKSVRQELASVFTFTVDAPQIGCRLPPKVVREKTVKQPKERDGYWEDEQTRVMGFRTATAINQQEGAVPDLTPWDIEELKSRTPKLWGNETTKAGRKTNNNNLKAKEAWYKGGNAAAIAKALSLSDSWAEKRHGCFEKALEREIQETRPPIESE